MAPSLTSLLPHQLLSPTTPPPHHHQQPSLPQCYPSKTTPMQLLKTSTSFFLKSRFLDGEFILSWWSSMTQLIGTGKPMYMRPSITTVILVWTNHDPGPKPGNPSAAWPSITQCYWVLLVTSILLGTPCRYPHPHQKNFPLSVSFIGRSVGQSVGQSVSQSV